MSTRQLFNGSSRTPKKQVTIYEAENGNEIMTHYGTALAGIVNGVLVKTDRHYSVSSTRNINLYLNGAEAKEMPQEALDYVLRDIQLDY